MKLEGKVAIVTGGARGIGRGIAKAFGKEGAHVVVADVAVKEGNQVVSEIKKEGGDAFFVESDVSKISDIERLAQETIKKYGEIDILANVAGISRAGKIVDVPVEDWDLIMNINLRGVFLCCKVIGKEMIRRKIGRIINMSSIAGRNAERGNVPYCATKAGVISITEGLALEMAEYKINVNAICPGATNTQLMQQVFVERGPVLGLTAKQLESKFESGIPLGRMGEPEDVGKVACFLASDDSSYITGQCIVIDGGMELTRPGL